MLLAKVESEKEIPFFCAFREDYTDDFYYFHFTSSQSRSCYCCCCHHVYTEGMKYILTLLPCLARRTHIDTLHSPHVHSFYRRRRRRRWLSLFEKIIERS